MKGTLKSFKKSLRSAFKEGVDRVRREKRGYTDEHTSDDYHDVSEDFDIEVDLGSGNKEEEGVSQSKRKAQGYKGEEPVDYDVPGMYSETSKAFDLDDDPPAKEIDESEDEDEEMPDMDDEDLDGEDGEDEEDDEEEDEDDDSEELEEDPSTAPMPPISGLAKQSTSALDSPMKQLGQKTQSLKGVAKVVSAISRAMDEIMPDDMSSTDRQRLSTWMQSKAKMMQSPGGMPSLKGTAKEAASINKKKVNLPE